MRDDEWKACVECAYQVPVEMVAPHIGMELVRCGAGLRHRDFDSLRIKGNLWKRWSGRTGILGKYVQGSTIQLVEEYAGIAFRDAVRQIIEIADPSLAASMEQGTGNRASLRDRIAKATGQFAASYHEHGPERPFSLPPASPVAENVWRYLTVDRAIMPEVVRRELMSGRLYEDTRHNCVFVGRDDNGRAAFAAIRSTSARNPFRMDYAGSRKAHSWRVVPEDRTDTALVFESPIEAMSYMSVVAQNGRDWQRSAYISLGGLGGAALFNFMNSHPDTERIYLCLNNDDAGREGARALAARIGSRASMIFPEKEGQDWNDVLVERCGRPRCERRVNELTR